MSARQGGVAIVMAMSVVALAAMAATAIMVGAGVDWARAVLSDDRRTSNVDHLGEPWALRLTPVPVDNGELAGHIEDEQGRFNLNNLVTDGKTDLQQLAHFRRLLEILELPTALANTLADWIDADSEPQGGAEDSYYLTLNPPYLAANRPLTDVSELSLVRGFDAGVRARLRPFVTALPRTTPVNVNTAPPEVLAAIVDGMTIDVARTVAAERDRVYFRTPAEFYNRLSKGLTVRMDDVAVSSSFFMATLRVTIGEAQARGSALLVRDAAVWPTIAWRKQL